jgi:hypothetical protein
MSPRDHPERDEASVHDGSASGRAGPDHPLRLPLRATVASACGLGPGPPPPLMRARRRLASVLASIEARQAQTATRFALHVSRDDVAASRSGNRFGYASVISMSVAGMSAQHRRHVQPLHE